MNIGVIAMNEEPYFSLEVAEDWKQIFTEDALSYLKSAQDKILYSLLDVTGYYTVQKSTAAGYNAWNRRIITEGLEVSFDNLSDIVPNDVVDYFGNKLPSDVLLDKIHLNFFSTLHSFFDTYAHFLHRTLFATEQNVPKNLSFPKVESKIKSLPNMQSISSTIGIYTSNNTYTYIEDMNNTNKHRRHISPQSTLFLNNGELNIYIPAFEKDGRPHDEQPMQDLLEDTHKFVICFFKHVTAVVLAHVKGNQSE